MKRNSFSVLCIVALAVSFASPGKAQSADQIPVYWANSTSKKLQKVDGGQVSDFLSIQERPYGMAIDFVNNKVYWTEQVTSRVRRANLDGSGVETIATGDPSDLFPQHIAIDVGGGKVYWPEVCDGLCTSSRIRRANLDGSNAETLLSGIEEVHLPSGIALDTAAGKMYWTNFYPGAIYRADLDGSNIERLALTGSPSAIALDTARGKIYWITSDAQRVRRMNIDGSDGELVAQYSATNAHGLALDPVAQKVYWTTQYPGRIYRASFDGSAVEEMLEVSEPAAIVLQAQGVEPVPAASSWTVLSMTFLLLISGTLAARRASPHAMLGPVQ